MQAKSPRRARGACHSQAVRRAELAAGHAAGAALVLALHGALRRPSESYVALRPARCPGWDCQLRSLEEGEKKEGKEKLHLAGLGRQIDLEPPRSWLIMFIAHSGLPGEGAWKHL